MEAGLNSAMLLVPRSVSMGTWSCYSQACQTWVSLLDSVPGAEEDFELGLY